MTVFSDAVQQDIAGNIPIAASLYEQVIHGEDVTLDAYLNLSVLYWQCIEPGFLVAGQRVEHDLFMYAAKRYTTVLHEAEKKFGFIPEIEFWRLYFGFITLGEPPFDEECKIIVTKPGSTLVPYFYLYSVVSEQQYSQPSIELLTLCNALPTTKNRYIVSVIEAVASYANTTIKSAVI